MTQLPSLEASSLIQKNAIGIRFLPSPQPFLATRVLSHNFQDLVNMLTSVGSVCQQLTTLKPQLYETNNIYQSSIIQASLQSQCRPSPNPNSTPPKPTLSSALSRPASRIGPSNTRLTPSTTRLFRPPRVLASLISSELFSPTTVRKPSLATRPWRSTGPCSRRRTRAWHT